MKKTLLFSIVFIGLFTGCSFTKQYVLRDAPTQKNIKGNSIEYNSIVSSKEYEKIISKIDTVQDNSIDMNKAFMEFYKEWKNVKYKFGGNSKNGIDCSAFTQRVYKEKFDIKIPRTTRTQVKVGKEIKKTDLELGDLVFFKTGVRDRHVGIYMGNGDFMHASTKGIKLTKLDKPYYKRKYWTSRRIID